MQRHPFSFAPTITTLFAISDFTIPTPLTTLNKLSYPPEIQRIDFLLIFALTLRIVGSAEVRPMNVKGVAHAELRRTRS